MWPKGNAVRSEVLIFELDETSTPDRDVLRLVGTGSHSSRTPTLFVLAPRDWIVNSVSNGSSPRIEAIPSFDSQLAVISEATYFKSTDPDATPFLVEPVSEGQSRELELRSGEYTSLVSSDKNVDLFSGPVTPWLREGNNPPRLAKSNELFVRRPGGQWSQLDGVLADLGLIELSWRDPVANIQIEKRKVGLLPTGAAISAVMKSGINGQISLDGFTGWTASVSLPACQVHHADPQHLALTFTGRPYYKIPIVLKPPRGPSLGITVTMAGRDPAVVYADGSIMKPGTRSDASNLRGAVAFSPHLATIHINAATSRSVGLRRQIDGELPLGVLIAPILSIFASMRDQDELVYLNFVGSSQPSIRISQYRFDPLAHNGLTVKWSPTEDTGTRPVVRMILAPDEEHDLICSEDGHWAIPSRCYGPCLLYLRSGIDVLSRPAVIGLPIPDGTDLSRIQSALSIGKHDEREAAIRDILTGVCDGLSAIETFGWLKKAISHLDGLSCKTFDTLALLPEYPEVLVRLLLNSSTGDERATIWSLQNELSFLWLGLPIEAWNSGLFSDLTNLCQALTPVLGAEKAKREAVAWLRATCVELTALEPALADIFCQADLCPPFSGPSLRDLVAAYIRDAHDRDDEPKNEIGAFVMGLHQPFPQEFKEVSHEHFSGLFAPLLLSLSACGHLTLDREMALLIRRTLLESPSYVSSAWARLIHFYGEHVK
jgi:hypothetical protein